MDATDSSDINSKYSFCPYIWVKEDEFSSFKDVIHENEDEFSSFKDVIHENSALLEKYGIVKLKIIHKDSLQCSGHYNNYYENLFNISQSKVKTKVGKLIKIESNDRLCHDTRFGSSEMRLSDYITYATSKNQTFDFLNDSRNDAKKLQMEFVKSSYDVFFDNANESNYNYAVDINWTLFDGRMRKFNLNGMNDCLQSFRLSFKSCTPGLHTPYLYLGSAGSVFALHLKDKDLLSINYMHYAADNSVKVWFGVPRRNYSTIMKYLKEKYMADFGECENAFRHKNFFFDIFSAATEISNNPDVYGNFSEPLFSVCVQRADEFVITDSKVFHMGYNTGYIVNEAINFGYDFWKQQILIEVEECKGDCARILKEKLYYASLTDESGKRRYDDETIEKFFTLANIHLDLINAHYSETKKPKRDKRCKDIATSHEIFSHSASIKMHYNRGIFHCECKNLNLRLSENNKSKILNHLFYDCPSFIWTNPYLYIVSRLGKGNYSSNFNQNYEKNKKQKVKHEITE